MLTPSARWTVKGGVSRGFKTPRLEQLAEGITGFGAQGTVPFIGSPGLRPETSTSTEVGAFQDKIASGPGLGNFTFRLAPDRTGCVDFGTWPNVDLFGQSINVDEAVTRGVEAATRLTLGSRVTLLANYTFTESEQRSGAQAGQPLLNTSFLACEPYTLNGQVQYASPYNNLQEPLRVWASMTVTF